MQHVWTIVCDKSVIDQNSNTLTILEVIEQINVDYKSIEGSKKPSKINLPINFEVISLFTDKDIRNDRFGEMRLELCDPSDNVQTEQLIRFVIPKGLKRVRNRVTVRGFPVTAAGEYTFRIKFKEQADKNFRVVAEVPVDVNLRGQ